MDREANAWLGESRIRLDDVDDARAADDDMARARRCRDALLLLSRRGEYADEYRKPEGEERRGEARDVDVDAEIDVDDSEEAVGFRNT